MRRVLSHLFNVMVAAAYIFCEHRQYTMYCARFITWLPAWLLRWLFFRHMRDFCVAAAYPDNDDFGDWDVACRVSDADGRDISWQVLAYFALTGRIEAKPFRGPICFEYIEYNASAVPLAHQNVADLGTAPVRSLGTPLAADQKSDMADPVLETAPVDHIPIHKYWRRVVDE